VTVGRHEFGPLEQVLERLLQATSTPFRWASPWFALTKELLIGTISTVEATLAPRWTLKKLATPRQRFVAANDTG
jgi:hypothetical protein